MEVELILAIVVAVCTAFYTFINALMLIESRKSRRLKSTPLIVAYLKSSENHSNLILYIENIGEGYAKDVKFNFKKDHKQFDMKMLSETYGSLKNGVASFPSKYKLEIIVDSYSRKQFELNDSNSYLSFGIEYRHMNGKRYQNFYELRFNQVYGIYTDPPGTYLGQIPYELKQLNKTLKNISPDGK
jgi:hypothetical protein